MTINEYQQLAMTTLNKDLDKKDVLINGVMGLCGESGEAIDLVKKWLAQGHELDEDKLISEIGDVAWYIAEIATALGVTLEDVLKGNIDKLKRRYPDGFKSEDQVVARLENASYIFYSVLSRGYLSIPYLNFTSSLMSWMK